MQLSPEEADQDWGTIALNHARRITDASPSRGSTTAAEAQAADYVQESLAALGIRDIRRQAFQGLRSIWLFLAFAFGFGLVGHAAFWLLRIPLGGPAALVVSILAFAFASFLMWRKFTYRDYPLRQSLPHGPSQNLIGVIPPRGEVHRRAVLIAHLDSHRQVFWYAADALLKAYDLLTPVAVFGLFLAPVFYGLSLLPGLSFLGWLGVLLALAHFLAWFTGITADLGPYSPGANDNASAVGTLLGLAERLQRQPLAHTEVWLAFTGCEETGCDGMLAFLDEHGTALAEALYIDFELVGIGERLVYMHSEGVARKRQIPARVEALVQSAGQAFGIQPLDAAGFGVFTEMGTVWERSGQGVCLLALREGSGFLPEWHRATDVASRLQPETLARVHALAWALLQKVDQE